MVPRGGLGKSLGQDQQGLLMDWMQGAEEGEWPGLCWKFLGEWWCYWLRWKRWGAAGAGYQAIGVVLGWGIKHSIWDMLSLRCQTGCWIFESGLPNRSLAWRYKYGVVGKQMAFRSRRWLMLPRFWVSVVLAKGYPRKRDRCHYLLHNTHMLPYLPLNIFWNILK